MKRKLFLSIGMAAFLLAVALVSTGCGTFLGPQFTYQGRLTDPNGNPLSGTYTLTLQIYDDDTGGTSLYTTTDVMTVTDGLFDTVIGPTTVIAGLGPEDLAQPLWLEVEVSDGSIAETLEPRQRLYGAPYAFTLMPGAYISETMSEPIHGAGGATAILNVVNSQSGDALPALRAVGDRGLEIGGLAGSDDGTIYSDLDDAHSDLVFYPSDDIEFRLDPEADSVGQFRIYDETGNIIFRVRESGEVSADGSFTGGGADFAEMVQPGDADLEPGDVLVIGPDGQMIRSTEVQQATVVGVYSTDPGFVAGKKLNESGNPLEPGQIPLAVVGRVPVKASAENGSIQPGDLLVTSDTPGHAMKANVDPSVGTVIGKALETLEEGTDVIQMLVMLQ
jgi:hypothetical protein